MPKEKKVKKKLWVHGRVPPVVKRKESFRSPERVQYCEAYLHIPPFQGMCVVTAISLIASGAIHMEALQA